jgi:hypothetical protein
VPLWCGDFDVVFSELHYHPLGNDHGAEFVELVNRGPALVDVSGWYLDAGVAYTFPPGTAIEPEGRLVVAADPARLAHVCGFAGAYGPWTGQLDNAGERIVLRRSDGVRISFLRYGDDGQWPRLPDGDGPSLELADLLADIEFPRAWQASAAIGGTPGQPNSAGALDGLALSLNEMGRTVGIPGSSWAEIYRESGAPVDLGGYVIARGPELMPRHTIPGGSVQRFAAVPLPFEVLPGSDRYFLLAPDGSTVVDVLQLRMGSQTPSTGRVPDGDNEVYACSTATPGSANESPISGDVYISEIMYHPPPLAGSFVEPLGLEYVAIANRGTQRAPIGGWYFSKGLAFTFPEGTELLPGDEYVIARDRDALLAFRPALAPAAVTGNFAGKLVNSAEKIYLRDAGGNLVDAVRYADDGSWPPEADGLGAALCLKTSHRAVDNNHGMAWEAVPDGNPGTPPAADVPVEPMIVSVKHDPPVPSSQDTVLVTCRIMDSDAVASASVRYAVDGGGPAVVALSDDGLHGDGEAGDGWWGAAIGPFGDGVVVAFHIVAEDGDTPGDPVDAPGPERDFLFAVDDSQPPASTASAYRVVVTDATWTELRSRDIMSNVLLDATFIGPEGQIRYNVGLRYRGSSSRRHDPKSYRISLHDDERFQGIRRLNLNRYYTNSQIYSMDFLRRAGLPYCQEWFVNLWIHGTWDDRYLYVEPVHEEFLKRYYGEEGGEGTLYRGWEIDALHRSADFTYRGTDPEEYRPLYENITGDWEHDDYAAIIALCEAFDPARTPDEELPAALEALIDTDQWLLFFAAQACLSNNEGNLAKDKGDDYFLYFRATDGKGELIPWDFDDSFHSATEQLFRPTVDAIERFLEHPAFAPGYYRHLERLIDGAFSPLETRRRIALLTDAYSYDGGESEAWSHIETFRTERVAYLREAVPRAVSAGMAVAGGDYTALIREGDLWRYFEGTDDPSGGDLSWTEIGFPDGGWPEGPSGFGYGDDDDNTPLDMKDTYTTVFIRRRFTIGDPGSLAGLVLRVDYDDAFSAFMNGTFVAKSRYARAGDPQHGWTATDTHEAGTAQEFDISADIGLLQTGDNVLAVVGFNADLDSSDFSLVPELLIPGAPEGGGCGTVGYTTADVVTLEGLALPAHTALVEINDTPVSYNYLWGTWQGAVNVGPGENVITIRAFDEFYHEVDAVAFTVHRVGGVSPLGGSVTANTVLTAAGGPYSLSGTLRVSGGATLTIQPGVTVIAAGGTSILVEDDGRIQASGTEVQPITFLTASCSDPWEGIGVRDTGVGLEDPVHMLRNCAFHGGVEPASFNAFLAAEDARLLVEDCRFHDLVETAVGAREAVLEVRRCRIDGAGEGIRAVDSQVKVFDSTLRDIRGSTAAIRLTGNLPDLAPGDPVHIVQGCTIEDCLEDGVAVEGGRTSLLDNRIARCSDHAIALAGDGQTDLHPEVIGNVITASGTGLAVNSGTDLGIANHNTVVGNQEGFAVCASPGTTDGAAGALQSSILWHNIRHVVIDAHSAASLIYSDIGGSTGWPGLGNISAPPRFVAEYAGDYHLAAGSPCIGTGENGTDMGALPFTGVIESFVRGDANLDGRVDLSDAIYGLLYLFTGTPVPPCLDAADSDDSGHITIGDAVYLLTYLYSGGPPPPAPFPAAGEDGTSDGLPCGP